MTTKPSWNQPICEYDWEKRHPDRTPVRVRDRKSEKCAYCGRETTSGIYVRDDPHNVKFPAMKSVAKHEPGEAHHYEMRCTVCGWLGQLRVSVEPQVAE